MENNPAAKHKEGKSEKETTNRHVYVEPGVQIDLVEDLKKKYDANQQDSTAHSKKILFWTKVSAGLLFIYAGLTAWQGYLTREALKGDRPILWVSAPMDQFGLDLKSGQFTWNINYKNFGKTPAINVRCDFRLATGKDALSQVKNLDKIPFVSRGSISVPNATSPDFCSGHPDIPMTDAELTSFKGIDMGIVIYGRIDYWGTDGTEYWSTICLVHQSNGAIGYCPGYSHMK